MTHSAMNNAFRKGEAKMKRSVKRGMMRGIAAALALCGTSVLADGKGGQIVADFTKPDTWGNPHHVADVVSSDKGLSFTINGEDPWFFGPTVEISAVPSEPRRMAFTMTCAPTPRASSWQLFFAPAGRPFSEKLSCRLHPVGEPPYTRFATKGAVPFNLKGPCHFRLDPPGGSNETFTVKGLEMEWRKPLWSYAPQKAPPLVIPASKLLVLKGRGWELRHDPGRIGAFRFTARGKTVENLPAEPFVYVDKSGKVRTLDWSKAKMEGMAWPLGEISTSAQMTDADGREWYIKRDFISEGDGDAMRVQTIITASKDGELAKALHIPALTLFVDRASNGRKHQAMLAGVEYLDDEPSSNTKEIRTHEHNRLIPAEYRLSAPMAVFTKDNSWFAATWGKPVMRTEEKHKVLGIWPTYKIKISIGGVWTESDKVGVSWPSFFATVFDTPDRLFNSGGHLLAFWAPAVGPERSESELDVYEPVPFQTAIHVVKFRAGEGASVADALEACFKEKKLPPPDAIDRTAALEQLAHGWLDSAIREGVKFKHAIGGHFKPGLVADAPVLMQHLAFALDREPKGDRKLAVRLRTTAAEVLAAVPKRDVGFTGVSHVRRPAPVLVAGDVPTFLARKDADLRSGNVTLASGKRIWKPQPGKPDFGATLGADHCNGYTAMALDGLLSAATWSGDEAEIAKALAIVDKVTALYHGTVPRGAQPWEMPLHTPDIMASAHLVRLYTLAYLLKPDPAYLREARHWAYGGLSMVYLVLPPFDFGKVADPVGRYATCAVMGATHWVAPNWIGRPVQWCGLVYSAALWDLARIEPNPKAQEFWRTVATGITVSGARQNHTADEPRFVGLLPDSWNLERQTRFPIPINPGTVQENFAEYVGVPFYSLRALARGDGGAPALIHAAGDVEALAPEKGTLRCRVTAWPQTPSKVVVTRVAKPQGVKFAGAAVKFEYIPGVRAAVVEIPARAHGTLEIAEAASAR